MIISDAQSEGLSDLYTFGRLQSKIDEGVSSETIYNTLFDFNGEAGSQVETKTTMASFFEINPVDPNSGSSSSSTKSTGTSTSSDSTDGFLGLAWWIWVIIGLVLLVVILGIIGAVFWKMNSGEENDDFYEGSNAK